MILELPAWFLATVAVSLGLALGSFLNVVVHRLPRGENVAYPASRCPACGSPIRAYDNVPVFSWLVLRGRARCCRAKISPRYPLVEALGGLTGWAVLEKVLGDATTGTPDHVLILSFSAYLILCLGLIALVFIDLEFMILPDEITLGGAALGLATVPIRDITWTEALVGAASGFFLVWLPFHVGYRLLRGHAGMGLGDAKLLLLAGAWLGWKGAVFALLAGAVQGTVVAVVVLVARGGIDEPPAVKAEREALRAELETLEGEERRAFQQELDADPLAQEPSGGFGKIRLPFGPFLALGIVEYLFFGDLLVERYLEMTWPA
ncbi:MAG TPA: prepilin peptidase [Polyangiaceae bacterium]|nr:prepilin peptidase [Polyangiaceae bacterium]